jgi:ribosomal protein S12 methylthiotransferase
MKANAAPKVGMISLGCAKNLVDAEIMLGGIVKEGMQITSDADDADVLIVNTCAFIDSAKEESIEAILESHENRGLKKRAGQRLIVTGCMAQRFSKELTTELSEVDAFLGLDQVADAGRLVREILERPVSPLRASAANTATVLTDEQWEPLNLVSRKPVYIPDWDTPRVRLTPPTRPSPRSPKVAIIPAPSA